MSEDVKPGLLEAGDPQDGPDSPPQQVEEDPFTEVLSEVLSEEEEDEVVDEAILEEMLIPQHQVEPEKEKNPDPEPEPEEEEVDFITTTAEDEASYFQRLGGHDHGQGHGHDHGQHGQPVEEMTIQDLICSEDGGSSLYVPPLDSRGQSCGEEVQKTC